MSLTQRLLLLLLASLSLAGRADLVDDGPAAAAACPSLPTEKPIATRYGSAGFMKNMAETEDSIAAIAVDLLTTAFATKQSRLAEDCESGCPAGEVAEIVYRVAPVAFLDRAEQNDVCLAFEEQTTATPMAFAPRSFATVGDMNAWIMAFSQGRGDDGKLLYERCSSNCSPRYTFHIAEGDAGYEVKTEVLCGLARDKSNDQYLISTALARRCAAKDPLNNS